MGDNPKDRGRKHLANKKKYKSSKAVTVAAKSKDSKPASVASKAKDSHPVLDSNWDRYEDKDSVHALTDSTNFAIFAAAPIKQGTHFQFKSDKYSFEENVGKSSFFHLDCQLLEKSLATIPFRIRSEISDEYFSQPEVQNGKAQAEYLSYLNNCNIPTKSVVFAPVLSETSDEQNSITAVTNLVTEEVNATTITPNLNLKNTETDRQCRENTSLNQSPKQTEQKEDDLEQWLDDYLDQ